MTEPAGEAWGWYWSHDEENYTGPFADRDEVRLKFSHLIFQQVEIRATRQHNDL